jgi:hypothetical protein
MDKTYIKWFRQVIIVWALIETLNKVSKGLNKINKQGRFKNSL